MPCTIALPRCGYTMASHPGQGAYQTWGHLMLTEREQWFKRREIQTNLANPKSPSFTHPVCVISILDGFKSLCIIPGVKHKEAQVRSYPQD